VPKVANTLVALPPIVLAPTPSETHARKQTAMPTLPSASLGDNVVPNPSSLTESCEDAEVLKQPAMSSLLDAH